MDGGRSGMLDPVPPAGRPSMHDYFHVILVIGFVVLVISHLVWRRKRSKQLIHKWAAENGYRLL